MGNPRSLKIIGEQGHSGRPPRDQPLRRDALSAWLASGRGPGLFGNCASKMAVECASVAHCRESRLDLLSRQLRHLRVALPLREQREGEPLIARGASRGSIPARLRGRRKPPPRAALSPPSRSPSVCERIAKFFLGPGPVERRAFNGGRQNPGRHDRRNQERPSLHLSNRFKRSGRAGPFHFRCGGLFARRPVFMP
jgi:hypothetical protein